MLLDFAAPFNLLRDALRRTPVCPPAPPDLPCPLSPPAAPLPAWVAHDPLVQKYRALIGDLPWHLFPERPTTRMWPGPLPDPRAPFAAAFLIKLHEGKRYMSELRTLPNAALQFLLSASVQLLQATLPLDHQPTFGDTIAGDTQAILAWVKQNNPKQYIKEGRLDKTCQPKGDLDCKLGVKSRPNRAPADNRDDRPAPTTDARAATRLQVGVDIFWGYASGIVVTRLPDGTEVVLAERTRPFNESDPSYFHPLMEAVEALLGRKPRYGAWDTAFDAHYVYDYFEQAGGFAAVPLNPGNKGGERQFAPDGAPLCKAGLPMPRLFTYQDRTALIPHLREKCGCPLVHPTLTGQACPIDDPHFASGGCTTHLEADRGSRIRLQLNRDDPAYKQLYAMRTMVERINAQAEALDILRPKLRRGQAIVNRNTLTYVLINLRALSRIRAAAGEGRPPSDEAALAA